MSNFTNFTNLDLRPAHDNRGGFFVRTPFQYHVGKYPSSHVVAIPKDFYTDGISVPVCFGWVIQRWGTGLAAGIVHDYLYRAKSHTRKEADKIFREALKVCGVSLWRRSVCYYALRMFGSIAWNRI